MELFSQKFREAVKNVLDTDKVLLAVVHQRVQDRLVVEAKNRADVEVLKTFENRDILPATIASKA